MRESTTTMDFFLKFLFLSGKYLTQITAQSIIEAYRRSMRLRHSLSSKLEKQFHPITPYENILELYNDNLDEITKSAQMQMAFISDAHKKEFERYLKEIEEEGSLKQLQRIGDERMLRANRSVVEEQFNKIEEEIKRDSLRRSQTPIFNVPRNPSSFKIPKGEDPKAKILHREWVARKSNKFTDDFEKLQEDAEFVILKKTLKEDDELLKSPRTSRIKDGVSLKSPRSSKKDDDPFELDETLQNDDDFLKLRQAQRDELLKLRQTQKDELLKLRKAWKDSEAFSKSLKSLEEDDSLQMKNVEISTKDEQSKASVAKIDDDDGLLKLDDNKLFKIRKALKGDDHLTELRKALNEDELLKLRKALINDDGLLAQGKALKDDKHQKLLDQKKPSIRNDELLKLGKKLYEDEQFGSEMFKESRFAKSTDNFRNRRSDREREFNNEISLEDYEKMCKALRGDSKSGRENIQENFLNMEDSDVISKETVINSSALKDNSLRMKKIVDSEEFAKEKLLEFKELSEHANLEGELLRAHTAFVKSKKLFNKESTDKNKTNSSEKLSLQDVESRLLKYKESINKDLQKGEETESKTQKVEFNLKNLRDKIIQSKGTKKVEENTVVRKEIVATKRDEHKPTFLKSLHEKIKLDKFEDQSNETKTPQEKNTNRGDFFDENAGSKSMHTIIESNLPPKPDGDASSNFTIILSMKPGHPLPETRLMEVPNEPLKIEDPAERPKRTTQDNLLRMKAIPIQQKVDKQKTSMKEMMGVLVFTPSKDNKYSGEFFDECQTNDVPCKIFESSLQPKSLGTLILTSKPNLNSIDYQDAAYIETRSKEIAKSVASTKKTDESDIFEPNSKSKPFDTDLSTPKPDFKSLEYKDVASIEVGEDKIFEPGPKSKPLGTGIFTPQPSITSVAKERYGTVILTPKPNSEAFVSKVETRAKEVSETDDFKKAEDTMSLDQLNIAIRNNEVVHRENALEDDENTADEITDYLGYSKPILVLTPNKEGPWDIHRWLEKRGTRRVSIQNKDLIRAIESAKEERLKSKGSLYRRELKIAGKVKTYRNAWPRLPLKDETMKDEFYKQPENPFLRKRWNRFDYSESYNKSKRIEYIETTALEKSEHQLDTYPQRVDKIKAKSKDDTDANEPDTHENARAEAKKRVARTLKEAERNASWLMKNIEEFLKFENRMQNTDFDKKLLTLDNDCRDISNTDQLFADFEEHLWKQTMEDVRMDGLRLNKSIEAFEEFEKALNSELRDENSLLQEGNNLKYGGLKPLKSDTSKFTEMKTRETVKLNKSLEAFEEFDRTLDSMRQVDEKLPQNLKEILHQKRADKTQNESIDKNTNTDVFDKLDKKQNISLEDSLSEDQQLDGLAKTMTNIALEEKQPKDQTFKDSEDLEKTKEDNLNLNRILKSGNNIPKKRLSDSKIPSLIRKDLRPDKNAPASKGFNKKTISLEGIKMEDDESTAFGFARTSLKFNKTIVEKNLVHPDKHNFLQDLKENKSMLEATKSSPKNILLSASQNNKTNVDLKKDKKEIVSKTETLKIPPLKKASTHKKEIKQEDASKVVEEKTPLNDQLLKSSKGDTSKGKTNKVFEDFEKAGKAMEARTKEIKLSLKREQSLMENSKSLDNFEVFLNPKLVEDVKVKENTEAFDQLMMEDNKNEGDPVLVEETKGKLVKDRSKKELNDTLKVSDITDEDTRKISKDKTSKDDEFTEQMKELRFKDSAMELTKSLTELDLILNFKSLQEKTKCFDDFLPSSKNICENPDLLNMQLDEFGDDVKKILELIEAKMVEMDELDYDDLSKVNNYITWKQEYLSRYRELHEIIKEPGMFKEIDDLGKLLEVNDAQCRKVMRNLTHKLLNINKKVPKMSVRDVFPLFLEWGVKVDEEQLRKEAAVIEANRKAFEEMEAQFKVVKIINGGSFNKGDDPNRLSMLGDQSGNLGVPKSPRGSNDKSASRKFTTQMQTLPLCILQKEETALMPLINTPPYDREADGMFKLDYDKILEHILDKENLNHQKSSGKDEAKEEEIKINKEEKAMVLLSQTSQKEEKNKMDKDNLGKIISVASSTTAQRANIFKTFQEHCETPTETIDESIENTKPRKSTSDNSLNENLGFIARLAKGKIQSLHELAIKSSVAELASPQRKLEATTTSTDKIKSQVVRNYSQKSIGIKEVYKLQELCEEIAKDYSKLSNKSVGDNAKAINTGDKLEKFFNESIGQELSTLKKEVFDGIDNENEITWGFEYFEFPSNIQEDFHQNVASGNNHDSLQEVEKNETYNKGKTNIDPTVDASSITNIAEKQQPVNSPRVKQKEDQISTKSIHINEGIEQNQNIEDNQLKPVDGLKTENSSISLLMEGIDMDFEINTTGDLFLESPPWIELEKSGMEEVGKGEHFEVKDAKAIEEKNGHDLKESSEGNSFIQNLALQDEPIGVKKSVGIDEHLEVKDAKVIEENNLHDLKEYTKGNSSIQNLALQEEHHKHQPIGVKKSIASKHELLAVKQSLQKFGATQNDEKIAHGLKKNVSNRDLPQEKTPKQIINASKNIKESKHDLNTSNLNERESKHKLPSITNDSVEGKSERNVHPNSPNIGNRASRHKFDTKATLLRKESKLTTKIEDCKYDVSKSSSFKSIPVHGKQSNQKIDASKIVKVSPPNIISKESKLKLGSFGRASNKMMLKKVGSKQSIKSPRVSFNEYQSKQKLKENEKLGNYGYEKMLPSELKSFNKSLKALPKMSSDMKTTIKHVDTSEQSINYKRREFRKSRTESLPDLLKLRISTDVEHEGYAACDSVSQNSSKTETILLHMKDLTSSNSSKCFGDYVGTEQNDQAKNNEKHNGNEEEHEKQLDATPKSLTKTHNIEEDNIKLQSIETQEQLDLTVAAGGNKNNSSLMLFEKKAEPLEYAPLHPDVLVKSLFERNIWSMMGLTVNPLKENCTSFEEFHKSQIAFDEVTANIIQASALEKKNLDEMLAEIEENNQNDLSRVETAGLFSVANKEGASLEVDEILANEKDRNSESSPDELKFLKKALKDLSMQELTKVACVSELRSPEKNLNDLPKADLKQPVSNARLQNDTSKEHGNSVKNQKGPPKVALPKTFGKNGKSQLDGKKIRSNELLKKQTVTDFTVVFERDSVTSKINIPSVDKHGKPESRELEINKKPSFTNLQSVNVKVKDVTNEKGKKIAASKTSNENIPNARNVRIVNSTPKKVVEKKSKIVASKKSYEDVSTNEHANVVKTEPKKLAPKTKKIAASTNSNEQITKTKKVKSDPIRDMKRLVEELQADLGKKIQCDISENSEEIANYLTRRDAPISKPVEILNTPALQFGNSKEIAPKTNEDLKGTEGIKGIEFKENQGGPKEEGKNEIEEFLAKGEIINLREAGNNLGRNNEMSLKQVKEEIQKVLAKDKVREIKTKSGDKEIDFVEVTERNFKDRLDLKAETTLRNTEKNSVSKKNMECHLMPEENDVPKKVSMPKSKDANCVETKVFTRMNKNMERTSNLPLKQEDKDLTNFVKEKTNEEKTNLMPQKDEKRVIKTKDMHFESKQEKADDRKKNVIEEKVNLMTQKEENRVIKTKDVHFELKQEKAKDRNENITDTKDAKDKKREEGKVSNKKAILAMPAATIENFKDTKVARVKIEDEQTLNPFLRLKNVTQFEQEAGDIEKNNLLPKKHKNPAFGEALDVRSAKNSNVQAKPQTQQISKDNDDQNSIKINPKAMIEEQMSKFYEVKSKAETKIEEKRNDSLIQKNTLNDKTKSKVEEEYNESEIQEKLRKILNKKKDRVENKKVDAKQKENEVKVAKDRIKVKLAELEGNLNSDGKVINKTSFTENTDKPNFKQVEDRDLGLKSTSNSKKDNNLRNNNIDYTNTNNSKTDINVSNTLKEEHQQINNFENHDGKLEGIKKSLEGHRDFIEKVKTNLKPLELETRSNETRLELETRSKENRLELEAQPPENSKIKNSKRSELESQVKENSVSNNVKPLELESQPADKSKNNAKRFEAEKAQPVENPGDKNLKRVELETQAEDSSRNLEIETQHGEENSTNAKNCNLGRLESQTQSAENSKVKNVKQLESETPIENLKLLESGKTQSAESRTEKSKRAELEKRPKEHFGVNNLKPVELETQPNAKSRNTLKHPESETSRLKLETQPTENPKVKKISFKTNGPNVAEENQQKEEFISVLASGFEHPEIVTYNPPPKIAEEEKCKIDEESSKGQENLVVVRKIGMIQNLQRANDFSPIRIFKNSIWNCEVEKKVSDRQLFMKGSKFFKGKEGKDKVKAVKNYKYERKEVMSALGKPITVTYLVEDVAENRK